MIVRALSFDVSTKSTGWAFTFGQARGEFHYGLIKTNPKFEFAERLAFFRSEAIRLLEEFRPTHVVIEDVYSGSNPKVGMLLAKFVGVLEECCFSIAGVNPQILHTSKVKSYFKCRTKEQVFHMIVDIFDWNPKKVEFKKHNDITDAIAQLLYFYEIVLNARVFREEKEYGYLYEV